MTQQWNNLLTHLGVWEGSFTRLSPQGEVIEDTPSLVLIDERQKLDAKIQRKFLENV